jgi:hypothetical protein
MARTSLACICALLTALSTDGLYTKGIVIHSLVGLIFIVKESN